jgi:dTDP-4-dehydrorhamnose reductase
MDRLLIIGARGFLGTYAARCAAGSFEVLCGGRGGDGQPGSVAIDISDAGSVERAFLSTRPDCVLLLAAMADIDRCEALPEEAFAVNARGAENVANACARANARLLLTSTAAIFDGQQHGYREEDPPSPVSVYGKTKVLAEKAVSELTPSAVILRFALALGFARKGGTNAMLDRVLRKWQSGEAEFLSTREQRNPIDAGTLSEIMIGLLEMRDVSGIFHAGATDAVTRYELGKRLAIRAGVPAELVQPQEQSPSGRAPRGEDHFLLTDKIQTVCRVPPITTDQVIERCFS